MTEIKIQMQNLQDVLYFNRVINDISCECDLSSISRRLITDAKSLLGTLSMNFRDILILEIYSNDPNEINKIKQALQKNIVKP